LRYYYQLRLSGHGPTFVSNFYQLEAKVTILTERDKKRLAARLPIPVATSSLLQIPSILAWLAPDQKIGIITYNASELGPLHFERLGIPEQNAARCYIRGAPAGGHLQRLVRMQSPYNFDAIETEMVDAAKSLVADHPDIGAIVLECTQMPPFGQSVQQAVNLPVYDVFTMASWFYSGVVRRRPAQWKDLDSQRTGPMVERNIM
jgi:hypothetical protein